MKKSIFIIATFFINSLLFSQVIKVNPESPSIEECDYYDLFVDGIQLDKIGTTCSFRMPQLVQGKIYTLELRADPNTANINLSIFDLVILRQLLLELREMPPLTSYLSDLNQDGAVGTYDFIKLVSIILAEDFSPAIFHVIKASTEVPDINFLDIQVDYSTLQFTSDDFVAEELLINVLQIGNLKDL